MSKELCADLSSQEILHTDTKTDGWLLTRVSSKIDPDPHKLRQFARLLGIDQDTYCLLQQHAEVNGQRLPLNVSGLLCAPSILPIGNFHKRNYYHKIKNTMKIMFFNILDTNPLDQRKPQLQSTVCCVLEGRRTWLSGEEHNCWCFGGRKAEGFT